MNPAGLRERRRRAVRDGLVSAALDLFRRKGFEATTVDEIADAAGVSRRSFFRYFPTKEAVAFPHEAQRLALFRRLLDRSEPGETPWGRVRRGLVALAADYMRDRDRILEQERIVGASPALAAKETRLDARWEEEIALALAGRRRGGPPLRARMAGAAVVGVVRAAVREWCARGGRPDLARLGLAGLDLIEPALRRKTWKGPL
ncbi:MAG: TetR family transcriptional regulator [Planctomycetes bacterium]|nr:TetR family transcriptional regulator [Planctomycetota bacterium]